VRLWRISNYANLKGIGGLRASARWHSRGRRIVYLADHPSTALLEVLVHLEIDPGDLPRRFQLLEVDVPDEIAISTLDEKDLPRKWRERSSFTRAKGDEWLSGAGSALMQVPSAILPNAKIYLLNPEHEAANEIKIVSRMRPPHDLRLFRRRI
jgi:RES domain-containing protein